MEIKLDKIGKRFIQEWVFRDISIDIKENSSWALIGSNGSGKSTLLQIISGYKLPSTGTVEYKYQGKVITGENIYPFVSFASPYIELIEEFTLKEQLKFHFTWRKTESSFEEIAEQFKLTHASNKAIKYFSSGMKQRLKLAVAFHTTSEILLLDEPFVNLDLEGIRIFEAEIENILNKKIIIVASNDTREYSFCPNHLKVSNYK